ncbi:MAG: AMP-binding protein [Acidobacteria bacterium]|nr:AMP-binding protein [Acidobacteriota bacterium]
MPYSTVYSVLEHAAATHGKAAALHQPIPGTKPTQYNAWNWVEYQQAVMEVACGLRQMGVQAGEIVALYSETRAEFYFADLGVMTNGSTAAALYTSNPLAENIRNLRACGAKVLFVEDPKTKRMLTEGMRDNPVDVTWILLTGEEPHILTLDLLREKGRETIAADPSFFAKVQADVTPASTAILYLTSGATGEPKMGLVTQSALVRNIEMGPGVVPLTAKDCTIAFLPSAHIAQRVVVELLPIVSGMQVWFSESLMRLPAEMQSIKPTMLLAPPRVWERVYASVCTEIRKKPPMMQKLFYGAVGLGAKAAELRREGKLVPPWITVPLGLADKVMFAKVRERLGGRLKFAISGSAPLGKDLALFFEAIGLSLVEGYGLTEGGVTHLNPIHAIQPGSIGKLLSSYIEHKLAEDGELLLKGPTIFSGYFNDPEATAQVLRDGWLYTGDIAEIAPDGFVRITGRKKELLVASNGKKIYPGRVESLFKGDPLISNVVLVGDKLPYITALITLNPDAKKNMSEAAAQEAVKAAVKKANTHLAAFEQIRKFKVLDTDFTTATGELTPTMKVRRARVLEKYKSLVEEMYVGKEESH